MNLRARLKLGIAPKILLTLLGLSLASLIVFGYFSLRSMDRLGNYALESSASLGNRAVSDSTQALRHQAEQELITLAKSQATISDNLFDQIEAETSTLANFATDLWRNMQLLSDRRSYSQEEPPENIYAASVYVLAPGVSADAVRSELNLSSNLDTIFIPITSSDKNLSLVYIGTESGILRAYPWSSGIDPSYDPRSRPWYTRAKETGHIGWSEPYIDALSGNLMVTSSKPYYDATKNLIGVVGLDVAIETISQRIINTQVGELGYAFLVDTHGHIIAQPELYTGDKRWEQSFETEDILNSSNPELRTIAERMTTGDTGISIFIHDGSEVYIAYSPLVCTGWSIGIRMPVTEVIAPALATKDQIVSNIEVTGEHILEQINNTRGILLAVFISMLLVVSALAYALSRQITRPILALNEGAKAVGSGDLNYSLELKTGDEIEDLANTFNTMTSNLKTYMENLRETTAVKERIESDLRIAGEIQASMLPRTFPPFPNRKEFDIFATIEPAKEVGGDFYDFFFVNENKLCFLIGDVSGKGVPAALFMAVTRTLLKTAALHDIPSEEILFQVNNTLCPDNDACMFATIACALLDTETGEVELSNAGHNPPLIYSSDRGFEFIDVPKGIAVGVIEDTVYDKMKFTLKTGNTIFLYTDGVTEAKNSKGKLFSEERLRQCLSEFKPQDPENVINSVRAEIAFFVQEAIQADDITMLALEFRGKAI
ncbi:SpoIIE family protein phosphatase [Chloroflexota bacterium]